MAASTIPKESKINDSDPQSRRTLKNYFKSGKLPNEKHFSDLIDSMVNIIDDGFAKTDDDGLKLAPKLGSEDGHLMSFYKNLSDAHPLLQFSLKDKDNTHGISLENSQGDSYLFIKKSETSILSGVDGPGDGNIGIRNTDPKFELDVNGTVGMKTRIGTYKIGFAPGDGKWHEIVTINALTDGGIHAFEIVASISGEKGKGKYGITHAIAVKAYGKSHSKIRCARGWFGLFFNRIDLRWKSKDINNYSLEIRTRGHYGMKGTKDFYNIHFHITNLWDESNMSSTEEVTEENNAKNSTKQTANGESKN